MKKHLNEYEEKYGDNKFRPGKISFREGDFEKMVGKWF